jgi:hypothetical protein
MSFPSGNAITGNNLIRVLMAPGCGDTFSKPGISGNSSSGTRKSRGGNAVETDNRRPIFGTMRQSVPACECGSSAERTGPFARARSNNKLSSRNHVQGHLMSLVL